MKRDFINKKLEFSSLLLQKLNEENMTIADLAKAVGVTDVTVKNWLKSRHFPKQFKIFSKLSKVLDCQEIFSFK